MTPDPLSAELASVRRELQTAKVELEELGHELSESNDARQASEACVDALRDFIAQHNVGVQTNRIKTESTDPPVQLPARSKGDDAGKPGTGWGFKLWKVDTLMSNGFSPISPIPQLQTAEPLSKKIGGFFSSKTSVPTFASYPPPSSNSYAQEPMYNGSDASSASFAEPVSPGNEGTGTNVAINSQSTSPIREDMVKILEEVDL
jgi:hypothetical protein